MKQAYIELKSWLSTVEKILDNKLSCNAFISEHGARLEREYRDLLGTGMLAILPKSLDNAQELFDYTLEQSKLKKIILDLLNFNVDNFISKNNRKKAKEIILGFANRFDKSYEIFLSEKNYYSDILSSLDELMEEKETESSENDIQTDSNSFYSSEIELTNR
ncbi:unnamed protein product, partial [marine sediment metagenome]